MVTPRDVRLRAAELIEQRGWTPEARDVRPLNTFRALQEAAAELGAPAMRRPALVELRDELGVASIFDWEAGLFSKRDGFEREYVRARTQDEVIAALRAQPWRPPDRMR